MYLALLLIDTKATHKQDILEILSSFDMVTEKNAVYGPYSVYARIETRSNEELETTIYEIRQKIKTISKNTIQTITLQVE